MEDKDPINPSEVARPAFLAALTTPSLRRKSMAFSKSPPVAARAFLQSIIPAPLFSRNSFTLSAEISVIKIIPYFLFLHRTGQTVMTLRLVPDPPKSFLRYSLHIHPLCKQKPF